MLDNLLYLLTDTVFPWYHGLLFLQIFLIWIAKRKKHKALWIAAYAVMIGSIVLSCVTTAVFVLTPGITHLADTFISIGATVVFPVMLKIASVVRGHE